jgi:hypothetical protein
MKLARVTTLAVALLVGGIAVATALYGSDEPTQLVAGGAGGGPAQTWISQASQAPDNPDSDVKPDIADASGLPSNPRPSASADQIAEVLLETDQLRDAKLVSASEMPSDQGSVIEIIFDLKTGRVVVYQQRLTEPIPATTLSSGSPYDYTRSPEGLEILTVELSGETSQAVVIDGSGVLTNLVAQDVSARQAPLSSDELVILGAIAADVQRG